MKIHPPKVIPDKVKPFEHALFDREEFGKSLVNLLRNVSDNLVIFVNAPWGTGKTTFAQMWLTYMREQQKLEVIYYDAYAADYFDDPFVSFSGEILELVDRRLAEGKSLVEREEFKKSAVEVGKKLAGLAVKVALRAATMGAIEQAHVNELKEISSEITGGISEIGSEIFEKKLENYTKEKDVLKAFKTSLSKLAAKVREEQGFPLTIVVDELDRCRPDFALGLLERIKHLFDVEGVAFVLLVNRDQIENYIRAVYGDKIDARSYLLKFGSIFVDLPNKQLQNYSRYRPGRKDYCHNLIAHHGLTEQVSDARHLGNCIAFFAEHFDLTLREIEKAFSAMTLFYSASPDAREFFILLVALLSVLKIKRPALYLLLSKNNVSISDFHQQSGLFTIQASNNEIDSEWVQDNIDYHLMSDEELELAIHNPTESGKIRNHLKQTAQWSRGANRKKLIPELCWHLDRLSLPLQ